MAALTIDKEEVARLKGMGFLSNKGTDNFSGRVITGNGKITAAQQICIAEAAEKFGNGTIIMTTRLTMEVPGIPHDKVEEFQKYIAKEGLETGGTGAKVRPVVSCKGTTCQYGVVDTFALSEAAHHRFYEGYRKVALPHKFKIAIGGCPNNCVKPDLNDIGVAGRKIFIGGRWGKVGVPGKALSKTFKDPEEILDIIEKAILLFKDQGIKGERFAQTIDRLGFEKVEELLLSNELLERKEEILAK